MASVVKGGPVRGAPAVVVVTDEDGRSQMAAAVVVVGADGSSATPAGENFIGQVGSPIDVISVIPVVLNADAYDAGDVVFDSTEIPGAVRVSGGRALLQSVAIIDKGDQNVQLRLAFFDSTVAFGTKDAVPSISDADALKCLGTVEFLAADFIDLGGSRVATKTGIGLVLEAAVTSIFVAAYSSGAPTYATGDLNLRLGLLQG